MINVGGELGSSDGGYYSTSPQMAYQPRTPTTTQQLTPQTPNTPTIILTGKYQISQLFSLLVGGISHEQIQPSN